MTDPATAEDRIAAIRARLDAATEGPWIKSGHDVDGNANVGAFCQDCTPPCGALGERVATAGDADAELIANAPSDLSWLLSELEAAQARLDKVRALHQRCDDGEDGFRPDGGYGTVAPCCETCGSYGEYTEPWPCATARALGLGEEGTE